MQGYPARIVHNGRGCPVCATTTPTLVVQAGPLPAPHPNPRAEFRDGGPNGTHWYHGTNFNPESSEEPKRLRPEPRDYSDSSAYHKHWNTDFGVHFTSMPDVAREFARNFAGPDRGTPPHARIAHADLHMRNPKHFDNEHAMVDHAIGIARDHGLHHDVTGDPEYDDIRDGYEDEVGIGKKDEWLNSHPHREQIVNHFEGDLKDKGHDGITYGNNYEGPPGHTCAIAFRSTPVTIHHWEHLLPPSSRTSKIAAALHDEVSPFGYHLEHFDIGERHHRVFVTSPGGQPRAHRLDYSITPENRIKYNESSHSGEQDHMAEGTAKDYIRAEWHPGLEVHDPSMHDPHAGAPKEEAKFYHGTTIPNVKRVLPANVHKGDVAFPHDTSREHAYATTNHDDAWDYAEKTWNADDHGRRPRVYEVKPIGGMKHVEEDPRFDSRGNARGNYQNDYRSKKGWHVVREVKMPEHMGDPEDWDQ